MSAPDPADVLVARAPDRVAVIVLRKDPAAALEFVEQLHDLRADVVIALRHDTAPTVARQRHTMPARFAGSCTACAGAIRVGEAIFFDYESRQAVHARCA